MADSLDMRCDACHFTMMFHLETTFKKQSFVLAYTTAKPAVADFCDNMTTEEVHSFWPRVLLGLLQVAIGAHHFSCSQFLCG